MKYWGGWMLLLLAAAASAAENQVETLNSRPGVVERFLFLPQTQPVASVILLAGGDGDIGIGDDGSLRHPGNFLVRSRALWQAQGFQVAVVDAPSDAPRLSDDFRQSAEHAADLAAVAAFLKRQASVPVWLIGTSRGTISAAAAALRLGDAIDGVVLTSSIVRGHGALFGLDLARLARPVLVVHHQDDDCKATPISGARDLLSRLAPGQVKAMIVEQGGIATGNACEAFAHHGYNGIEDQVVKDIADWIKAPANR